LIGWKKLLDNGIYVNLVLPPAAPDGSSLLRCSVSAEHASEQIYRILTAFKELAGSDA
jgi:8-amino-7-oxononanoate synthase